ncbi:MAG TPA: murein L,D-transpeptidase catalytic domain family protein [Longimicrobiales bacterium]
MLVQSAITALAPRVSRLSNDDALRIAFQAYYNFKASHPEQVRKPYLYFVDYGLNNRTARGYVFDMENLKLVEGPFMVAHGRGSSVSKNAVPTRFSNRAGGAATSLGLYVTQESYSFVGHAGGVYHSVGLRLRGVSGRFNDRARARGVVMHGAPYVTRSGSGRSQGCPAVDQARAHRLIPKLANGSLVFLYSPQDATWLQQDPWVHGESLAAN